jgi:hypothetical protein
MVGKMVSSRKKSSFRKENKGSLRTAKKKNGGVITIKTKVQERTFFFCARRQRIMKRNTTNITDTEAKKKGYGEHEKR